jgi:DNA-binding transcriptional MerR regulator
MFTVGEFSRLARVSKRLLRYYDEIDLLKPAYTDNATGYRYYQAEQMAHLNRILVLKELGLSLDQIRTMLRDRLSTDELEGMLRLKKAEIERTLRAELQRIRKIEARLHAIYSVENEEPLDVVIKSIPAQFALSLHTVFDSFASALEMHRYIQRRLPAHGEYGLSFTICHDEEIAEQNLSLEIGRMIEVNDHAPVPISDTLQLSLRQLPAVEMMATTIVTGGLEAIHAGYSKMAMWAQTNGFHPVAMPREMMFSNNVSSDGHDLITEIQFPVEPEPRIQASS